MKEKPILFSTPMVKSILDNRKSQTRRIINPQPVIDEDSGYAYFNNHKDAFDTHSWKNDCIRACRFQIGDILWVRETWAKAGDNFHDDWPGHGDFYFKADNPFNETKLHHFYPEMKGWPKWRPSIFMPKEACRIKLKVTDIRVERLNDISEEDVVAEGVEIIIDAAWSYEILWKKINGEGSWKLNPWVWVISFSRLLIKR